MDKHTSSIPATTLTHPVPTPQVADPYTLAGQQTGAILSIKRIALGSIWCIECWVEVGDLIELLDNDTFERDGARAVKAKNLRTQAIGTVMWNSVFPVGEREVCACYKDGKYACRCVYVDFEKSKVSGVIIRILVILIDWVWLADSDS